MVQNTNLWLIDLKSRILVSLQWFNIFINDIKELENHLYYRFLVHGADFKRLII